MQPRLMLKRTIFYLFSWFRKNWQVQPEQPSKISFKISLWIGKNLEVQPKNNAQKFPILNLWMNWEKLGPNLCFTVENKASNLHKIKLLLFQIQWMRYSITSNFKNLLMNWEKYVFYWEKWNFEPIMIWKGPE